jgi:hypothetical protein
MLRMSYRTLGVVAALFLVSACSGHSNPIAPTPDPPPPSAATAGAVFVTPHEALPVGGGKTAVEVYTSLSPDGRSAATFVPVHLEVSAGSLSAHDVTTDRTGHATVEWAGDKSATITAIAQAVRVTNTITVQAPPAASSTPQPGCTGCVPPTPPSPVPPFIPAPAPAPPPPPPPPPPPAPSLSVTLTASPENGVSPLTVAFTATPTTEGDVGTIVGYSWDWESSETTTPIDTTLTGDTTHDYLTSGVRTVTVTVHTDTGKAATAQITIAVS